MIDQLLGGPEGLASGGKHGNGFTWVVDTNAMREANLVLGAEEVAESMSRDTQSAPSDDGASITTPKNRYSAQHAQAGFATPKRHTLTYYRTSPA